MVTMICCRYTRNIDRKAESKEESLPEESATATLPENGPQVITFLSCT